MHTNVVVIVFVIFCISISYTFDCDNSNGKKLQIHMVPHTHDDVGWQKTVDQYYYGSNRTIQAGAVQYILDTTVAALAQNPRRTFIFVEMAFFKRWWEEQDDSLRSVVKNFVANKQLEFINGGWSMSDEACTHYNGIIDQMTYGLRFIDDTFGPDARPTVAWHIDPFGHSAEQASLFSLMSFDGFFFGRIDEDDKQKRLKEQRMEMVWRGSRNYEKASQIFSGVLYNGYNPPDGFCYDEFCADPPIQDDPLLYDMNVQERVDAFVKITCEQAKSYKTNHIILTMGSDFQYENAHRWFINMDKLLHYVNQDGRVNLFYSTPSRYLEALHAADEEWGIKSDDFFPYAHCPHCYWTGYFTSRPALKGYIRESNDMLQACKQVEAIHGESAKYPTSDRLRRAMAVNQHHDAITGTEKQHVQDDYVKRLYEGREECWDVMTQFLKEKYSKEPAQAAPFKFVHCDYLNISVCRITETDKSLVVNVYNPLGHEVTSFVRMPVNTRNLVVKNSNQAAVTGQILPVSRETASLRRNLKGFAAYALLFEVTIPPLGFSTYFVNQNQDPKLRDFEPEVTLTKEMGLSNDFIENEKLRLEFSVESGRLVRVIRKDTKLALSVDQEFFYYEGSTGNNDSIQTSGAYIFRPNSSEPRDVCEGNKAKVEIIKGPLVEEVRQTFGTFVSQVVRLYKGVPYAEFEHTVGPIPVKDSIGKEIITNFETNIESGSIFYTDANGREMKERKRNHRETWNLNMTEPISQNYYPINSRISINDSTTQLTIMSDRSQGGSSIRDGQIEIMVHRRLLRDDFLGVGEALNEPGVDGRGLVTRGKHRLLLSTPGEAADLHRRQGQLMLLPPIVSFASNSYGVEDWLSKFTPVHSGLSVPLPDNVHLLTLETVAKDAVIVRLEHYFEKDEDKDMSKPVGVTLTGLFVGFKIVSIVEMNLSANQYLKDKKVMKWNTREGEGKGGVYEKWKEDVDLSGKTISITLKPMEIRTFLAKVERK